MTTKETVLGITVLAFFIGNWWGSTNTADRLMQEEMSRYGKFAELDKVCLQSLPARTDSLRSGAYLMDVWFVGTNHFTKELAIICDKGQINVAAFNRNRESQTLSVAGNVVSWTQEGALYEADPKYVGLIDGDQMWGRVYGWNPGDGSVGFWRIYPKPKTAPKEASQ